MQHIGVGPQQENDKMLTKVTHGSPIPFSSCRGHATFRAPVQSLETLATHCAGKTTEGVQ